MEKKYTYKDWLQGKLFLQYSTKFFNKNQKDLPIAVWDDFSDEDVLLIKSEQKKIFDDYVAELLQKWQKEFHIKFEVSQMKATLLKQEFKAVGSILFTREQDVVTEDKMYSPHFNFSFDLIHYERIQQYAKDGIVKGQVRGYDFIHSKKCKFKEPSIIHLHQVYAKALFEYGLWLQAIMKKSKIPTGVTNPDTDLFKSDTAYALFLKLKEEIVRKGTEYADYSFIYHSMKSVNLLKDTVQKSYISFIENNYRFEFKENSMKNRTSNFKEKIFSRLHNEFYES